MRTLGDPAARRLRPWRIAEVVVVRRLPAEPRLPDAHRPLPARAPAARRLRLRDHRPRRRSRRPSTGCTRETCCAPWWSCDRRSGRPWRVQWHLLARRRDVRRREQHLGGGQRRRVRGHRRATLRLGHRRRSSAAGGCSRSCAPTPTTTTCGSRPSWRRRSTLRSCCTRTTQRSGRSTHPDDRAGRPADGRQADRRRGHRPGGAAHSGHSPGSVCLYSPTSESVFTGDTLFEGGPGRHRPQLLRPRHDRREHPGPAVHAARRDRRCTPGTAPPPRSRPSATAVTTELELADWRRRVAVLYAAVRAEADPESRSRDLAHGSGRAVPHPSAEPAPRRRSAAPGRSARTGRTTPTSASSSQ